jgi:hypothetical protein
LFIAAMVYDFILLVLIGLKYSFNLVEIFLLLSEHIIWVNQLAKKKELDEALI